MLKLFIPLVAMNCLLQPALAARLSTREELAPYVQEALDQIDYLHPVPPGEFYIPP